MNINPLVLVRQLDRARASDCHGAESRLVARLEGALDYIAEGCVRCVCGSKYWEHTRCIDCGTDVSKYTEQLEALAK